MSVSVSSINSTVQEAVDFIRAGDYLSALPLLISAKALLIAIPDTEKKGSASLHWDRAAVDNLIAMVERQIGAQAAGSAGLNPRGVIRQKVSYKRPRGFWCD